MSEAKREPQDMVAYLSGQIKYSKYKTIEVDGELTPMFDFSVVTEDDYPTVVSGTLFADKAKAAKGIKKGDSVRLTGFVVTDEWGDEKSPNTKIVMKFDRDNEKHGIFAEEDVDPVNMVHLESEVVWVGERRKKDDSDELGPLTLSVCRWTRRKDGEVKRSSSNKIVLFGSHADLEVAVGDDISCHSLAISNQKDDGRSYGKLLATQDSKVEVIKADAKKAA